jgi:hypothetical protein
MSHSAIQTPVSQPDNAKNPTCPHEDKWGFNDQSSTGFT